MQLRRTFSLVSLCLAAVVLVEGQTTIRQKPISPTSAASGQEMYMSYCASCHGKDGKGGGPAAAALKHPPTDLTLLSRNSKDGTFPSRAVSMAISGASSAVAHGSREMPVWGEVFSYRGAPDQVALRVRNLTSYIESLQAK